MGGSSRWGTMALAVALCSGGCDETGSEDDFAESADDGGVGGKADEADAADESDPGSIGPAGVVVNLAESDRRTSAAIYWGRHADEANRVTLGRTFSLQLHGHECITVVSKNRASPISFTEADDVITQSCDLGLLAGKLNEVTLPILTVTPSEYAEVDAGDRLELLGLKGDTIVNAPSGSGYHSILPNESFVVAPGNYEVKMGHSEGLGRGTEPLEWSKQHVELDGEDAELLLPEWDVRTLVLVHQATEPSELQPARSLSGCQPRSRVSAGGTHDGDWSHDLDEGNEFAMLFTPFPGMHYQLLVSGMATSQPLEAGEDVEVQLYRHEVPLGEPAFEGGDPLGGTFSIARLEGNSTVGVRCSGANNPNNSRDSHYRIGTYLDLPAGRYREVIKYTGFEPTVHEFEVG